VLASTDGVKQELGEGGAARLRVQLRFDRFQTGGLCGLLQRVAAMAAPADAVATVKVVPASKAAAEFPWAAHQREELGRAGGLAPQRPKTSWIRAPDQPVEAKNPAPLDSGPRNLKTFYVNMPLPAPLSQKPPQRSAPNAKRRVVLRRDLGASAVQQESAGTQQL